MLVSLTVGKVDAGVAVLLTEDKRLIEFPSILLPPEITSGSIVDINVARNFQSEAISAQKFSALQDSIYTTFGQHSPSPPVLRCRNATQTSIVLEWDPVSLATAELRTLSLYRNGSKAGNIPRDKLSTKISGLAVDTEYNFHLVLRTTAGTYHSEKLVVRTQKMTDLTGITVTPGVMPQPLRDELAATISRIGAKLIDTVRIDTTHFICTEGRGQSWEKAVEMNVPVVVPDWLKGCEAEGRIVGVRGYYLNADPKLRNTGPGGGSISGPSGGGGTSTSLSSADARRESQQQHALRVNPHVPHMESPRIEHTPPTPERTVPERELHHGAAVEGEAEAEDAVPPTPPPKPRSQSVVALALGEENASTSEQTESEAESTSEAAAPEPTAAASENTPTIAIEQPNGETSTTAVEAPTEPTQNAEAPPAPAPAPPADSPTDPEPEASSEAPAMTSSTEPAERQEEPPAAAAAIPETNNLKAIGIPHAAEEPSRNAKLEAQKQGANGQKEDEGFDDVAL